MVVERAQSGEKRDEGFPRGGKAMSKGMGVGNCHISGIQIVQFHLNVECVSGSNRRYRFKWYFETYF